MARIALIVLLSASLVLTGCTGMRDMSVGEAAGNGAAMLKAGDTIRVTQRSGEVRRLKLTVVAADALTGSDIDAADPATVVQIAVADIQSLQVKKTSWVRSIGAALGLVATAFVVAVLAVVVKCGYIGGDDKCSD